MRSVVTVLLPFVLAGCAAPYSRHEAASVHGPLDYSCEGGLSLRVRLARDGAHVTLPSGEEMFLPQKAGGAYASAQSELAGTGERTTWKGPGRTPVACRVVP